MKTFKAYFKKEALESARQYRYLILLVGVVLFAIATPIMLKLLPKLIEGQLNADLSTLFAVDKRSAIQSYIGDLFEIGYIVVILALSGLLCDELHSHKLVFPYSKGGSPWQMVLAKFTHYALVIFAVILVGFAVNYYYVNIIISGESIAFGEVMAAALLISLYFVLGLSMAMLFSSLLEKSLTSGIVTLAVSYVMAAVSGIKGFNKFMPYNLIQFADSFTLKGTFSLVATSLVLIAVMLIFTCRRMTKAEVI